MNEKTRTCILCGKKELMPSYVCDSCQVKVRGEILGKKKWLRKEAEQALKQFGENPDKSDPKTGGN